MEAVAGIDVGGDIFDDHATAPHVFKEGDCHHQWSAPLSWAGEQDA